MLKETVREMGGAPSTDSGAWGTFVQIVQGSATLLGENAAIGGLSQGEEHGKSRYENALENECVMSECKEMIRNQLLPRQIRHIDALEKLRN